VDPVILQGANHFQARAVAHVRQPRIFVAAEIALEDAAVLGAVEKRAPGFQFADAIGRFLGVQLGHAPIVQVLAAPHRVGEMDFPVVPLIHVGQRRRNAALGHDGMSLAQERFADHAHGHTCGGGFYGRAQSSAAGPDDQHVVLECLVFGHGI